MKYPAVAVVVLSGSVALVAAACGTSPDSTFTPGAGADGGVVDDSGFQFMGADSGSVDAFINDPPAPFCGAGSAPKPADPGGTLNCPNDKRLKGCACTAAEVGKSFPCWPGLRANRSVGACKDGMTTCTQLSETTQEWSECAGAVLPVAGSKKGKEACKCFSAGQWKIDNLIPCFEDYGMDKVFAVSTVLHQPDGGAPDGGGAGIAACPDFPQSDPPPPKLPPSIWSPNSLNIDCAGHFTLCYELKAGDFANPLKDDCSLTKVCTEGDYPVANVETKFPDLGAWTTSTTVQSACSKKFRDTGGYGEMTVKGKSIACDEIDDGAGNAYVFNRVSYCKQECGANPTAAGCMNCQQGGNGKF